MSRYFNARQPRDRFGRWAASGRKLTADQAARLAGHKGTLGGAAAGAVVGGALASKPARRRYVPGSLQNESYVGTSSDGKFSGVKVGAIYRAPGGREVLVKGIVGVSAKPNASKPAAASSAGRKASAGTKAHRPTGSSVRANSAGKRVRR